MGCFFTKIKENEQKVFKILYVEDSDIYISLLEFVLEKYLKIKFKLIHKKTISEVIKYMNDESNKIDLILLDRELQNEMGDQLIKENIFNDKKVIIISNIDNEEDIERFSNLGINYFVKPLDIKSFIEAMEEVFD